MKNPFQSVPFNKPKRNKFDLSHEKKMSMKFGNLYPMYLEEIIPGDSIKCSSEILMRFAPLLAPVMHRINVYTHYFFVPNRLVWTEWEDFITGGEDGNADPTFPTLLLTPTSIGRIAKGSLADYFGIPLKGSDTIHDGTQINALPFRAYQMIYNEYYRDQNLIDKVDFGLGSGNAVGQEALTTLRERAWEKDYLTSSLPWSQKGGEAEVPVTFSPSYQATSLVKQTSDDSNVTGDLTAVSGQLIGDSGPARIENLSGASGEMLINDLRKATRLQEWLEKNARGGSRYIESILSHFGVKSSDARLQRPEYLGGGSQPVVISEVLNTTGTAEAPQGDMAGHGISVGRNNGFKRSFEEHGYVIGIISVVPKTAYQQGLARSWRKFDKFDYYWPEFAHLGEQEVTESEAFFDFQEDNDSSLTTTFGYQQRYAEYKYKESQVSGDFRLSLDFWHLGRIFETKPWLNQTFITCRPRTDIFAVQDGTDYLWVQIYHKISALRPMPYFAIPSL